MFDDQYQSNYEEDTGYPVGMSDISSRIQKAGGPPYTVFLVGLSSDFNSAMLTDHFIRDLGY